MATQRLYSTRALLLICIPLLLSCTPGAAPAQENAPQKHREGKAAPAATSFPETFESGNKRAYASGDAQLATGLWRLDNALIGKTDGDAKSGAAALRVAAGGSATMLFDVKAAIKNVRFSYALYGHEKEGSVSLWYSADGGAHWLQTDGRLIVSTAELKTTSFAINAGGALRFSLHNDGKSRVNIDDFDLLATSGETVNGTPATNAAAATRDDNMALGNPSGAAASAAFRNNYLLAHPQYTLSYNNDKGMANWVSWHLSMAWRGTATRCNCFFSDAALPDGFFHATTSNYIGTGFDRGHLCPSDDRTASAEDNAATFLMSNMSPQAPFLNQQTWEGLEEYARALTGQGNELYIIAGGYGQGGEGSKGGATTTIAGGSINVPARFWKIIVVLPVGANDLQRITKETRVIAVDMPNVQSVNAHDWGYYRTSVRSIEAATGYNFFSNVSKEIATALKSGTDAGATE